MGIPLADLKAQYQQIKPQIDAAMQRVVQATSFIMGKEVTDFEAAFAAYCGAQHGIGVSSGTSALHLALLGVGVGPGDEVITTPFTFIATVEAIGMAGARPVFVDIERRSFTLDAGRLEAAITSHTKAILPVHLYGQPAEMDAIHSIADRHGLVVIEDAAQAHGAEYRGRRAGALARAACFSFYPGKNLGAYGDAGAVVTDDAELAEQVRLLRDHGRHSKYEHKVLGFGERLDALQAAILGAKLPFLEQWTVARRGVAAAYRQKLADLPLELPAERPEVRHVYHQFVLRTPQRDALLAHLKEQGIGAGVHYPIPLHRQPALQALGYSEGDFPESEAAAREVLSLPMYAEMTDAQIDQVVQAVRSFFQA